MDDDSYPDYPYYDEDGPYNQTSFNSSDVSTVGAPAHCLTCVSVATISVIITILGVAGNGLVIWIAGFKIKKTVNSIWYLSLAVSDLLFCAFLPLSIVYTVKEDWIFGRFMCKFTSFILHLNMFSSVFLLLLISVDRCGVVMLPVWAQNKRTIRWALVMVLLAWIISAFLSLPAAIFRETVTLFYSKQICYYNYAHDEEHVAVVVCRFVFGFLIPLLIIIICYVLIARKMKSSHMAKSGKPFKIMTALIVAFVVSWIPYHVFHLMELNIKDDSVIGPGQTFGSILAGANSFMNPLLYAFMGKDFKKNCYALLAKIESTFEEEPRSTLRATSITTSGDGKLSTGV